MSRPAPLFLRSRPRPMWLLAPISIAIATLALVACSDGDDVAATATASDAPDPTVQPLIVTDDTGTQVEIAAPPRRIVAVLPSVTYLLLDLGLGDRIVASDNFSLEAAPEMGDVPSVGGEGFAFNLELTTALQPDLIVIATGGTESFVDQARALDIPVLALDFPSSVDEMLEQVILLGDVFDVRDEAAALVADLRARLDAVSARYAGLPPVRVYMELDQSTPTRPFSVGPGSLHDDVIRRAGGVNILSDAASAFPQVNYETIIAADPDLILLLNSAEFTSELASNPVSPAQIGDRPGWGGLTAVRNGNVVGVDQALFGGGLRIVDAVEQVAQALARARAATAP